MRKNFCTTWLRILSLCAVGILFMTSTVIGQSNDETDPTLVPGKSLELGLLKYSRDDFFIPSKVLVVATNDNLVVADKFNNTYNMMSKILGGSFDGRGTVALNESISFIKPFDVEVQANVFDLAISKTTTETGIMLTNFGPDKVSWTNSFPQNRFSATWSAFVGTLYNGEFENSITVYKDYKPVMNQKTLAGPAIGTAGMNLTYQLHFDPNTHILTVTYDDEDGKKQTDLQVPDDVKTGSLALYGQNNGRNQLASLARVKLDEADGYYQILDVPIKYKNSRGETLGKDSMLMSSNKQKISISGHEPINVRAPEFKGFKLRDEKRIVTAGTTKQLQVNYDYEKQDVPIHIIDEDDTDNNMPSTKMNVDPWKPYNITTTTARQFVPKEYSIMKVDKGAGQVEVDVSGNAKIVPITIHVKHVKVKTNKVFTRTIHYQFAEGVAGKIPKDVLQTVTQYVEEDLANGHIVILGTAKVFPAVKVPVMDGYESDITDIPKEELQNNQPLKEQRDVTFYYLTKLIIPNDFDFGTVPIGSLEYYGARPVKLKKISGQLGIEAGNPANKKFDVAVNVSSDIKSTLFKMNDRTFGVGDSLVVYQYEKKNDDKKVILLDDKNKDATSLQMFNATSTGSLGNTSQKYTFNWALRSVPV